MIEHLNRITENLSLSWRGFRNIDGTFCIDRAVLDYMLAAPFDIDRRKVGKNVAESNCNMIFGNDAPLTGAASEVFL